MKNLLLTAALLLVFVTVCASLFAQGEVEEGYSFGIVSSVSSNSIVIKEYDYDNDQEIETSYIVESDAELINVDSLESIKVGDRVSIDYVIKDGNRVAKTISLEIAQEEVPTEMHEEMPEHTSMEIEY